MVKSFSDIVLSTMSSFLLENGFYHTKRLAITFDYDIGNSIVECVDCGYLHVLHDNIDINSLKITHLTNSPNCPTARANAMGLDLI